MTGHGAVTGIAVVWHTAHAGAGRAPLRLARH